MSPRERLAKMLEDWLREAHAGSDASPATAAIIDAIVRRPEHVSYASATAVATSANVDKASVTRAAQFLGYRGWPELRQEIRARYLASLSAPDVAATHAMTEASDPAQATLRRSMTSLSLLQQGWNAERIGAVVDAIAGASRVFVVADGSYRAVAVSLTHNAGLAGYPMRLLAPGADTANGLFDLTEADVVIAVGFWRVYADAIRALDWARARSARTITITDSKSNELARRSDLPVIVPAEGASFFPSMAAAVVAVEAICAHLAQLAPADTARRTAQAEEQWSRFEILQARSGRPLDFAAPTD